MSRSDDDLVTKAVGGDADALASLLECFGPRVRKGLAIGRRWQSVLSADDVMQVTYIEAFLHIGGFMPGDDRSFYQWLRRIAANNLRDAIRELTRKKRPPPEKRIVSRGGESSVVTLLERLGATSTTPSSFAGRHEAKSMMDVAMQRLPEDYATVLRLYDLEGRPVSQVASAMERSCGAVFMLRSRAMDRLRELLGPSTRFFGR